ncbi:MAG: hypothetical protein MI723_08055, partial [Caulobacterales bacterium]|nr:hypothetical protein [Caulobacterales bacterium]
MLRLLASHLIVGVGAGWTVLFGLLALDTAGLRTLILTSPDGGLAAALLAFFVALTFGGVGMGAGVMLAAGGSGG